MGDAAQALVRLAADLRDEGTPLSPHVVETAAAPALGLLAAEGPRAASAPAEYALLVETIREGYLLHYGRPRLIDSEDRDLRLLGGDYLYARGLERLGALGDLEAVRELADLVSLCAQVHADGPDTGDQAGPLWLAAVTAVTAGAAEGHEAAKAVLRSASANASTPLWLAAHSAASAAGLERRLKAAAEAVGFRPPGGDPQDG